MNKSNNNNNGYRDEKSFCYFHPRQLVVGVCPLCLNERLLILAAKQGQHRTHSASKASSRSNRIQSSVHRKTTTTSSSSSIHKILAFGSLFTRHEPQQWKSETINFEYDASPSPEESFISIKFEENGVASWEKSKVTNKVSLENCNWNHHTALQIQNNKDTNNNNNKSVIEHGKSRDRLRWRKRIGHMFHLIRWRRNGGVCHVSSKVERGVKVVRKGGGLMRTLTKRNKTLE